MLDAAVSYNRYKFLGYEFLTWLWFAIESEPESIGGPGADPSSLELGNRIVLENKQKERTESITIKGDDANLEEGMLSLRKGALVTDMNLTYKIGEQQWNFNIKAENLALANLRPPESAAVQSKEEIEGAVIERVYLCEKVVDLVNHLFCKFIKLRVSAEWSRRIIPEVKAWIGRHSSRAAA